MSVTSLSVSVSVASLLHLAQPHGKSIFTALSTATWQEHLYSTQHSHMARASLQHSAQPHGKSIFTVLSTATWQDVCTSCVCIICGSNNSQISHFQTLNIYNSCLKYKYLFFRPQINRANTMLASSYSIYIFCIVLTNCSTVCSLPSDGCSQEMDSLTVPRLEEDAPPSTHACSELRTSCACSQTSEPNSTRRYCTAIYNYSTVVYILQVHSVYSLCSA